MISVAYDHQIFALQEYGGVSRYFCELAARVQHTAGFSAKVVAPLHFNTYLAQTSVQKFGLHLRMRVPRTSRLYSAGNALIAPLYFALASPSLIHRTYYGPMTAPGAKPMVITVFDMIHELFADAFSKVDKTSPDKRICVDRADHIICISECTANDLVRLFGVDRKRVSVVHLGYSDIFEATTKGCTSRRLDRPYLLYVGQRSGYKNFESALSAYARSPQLRTDFDFLAFGGKPFTVGELRLIQSHGLRPGSVRQRSGADEELAHAYVNATAFIYPSMYEGFGIPVLEAMGCGCPVVCSNTSSIPEVAGDAAEFFDPADIDSITAALELVCQSEQRRAALIAAGKQRVRHFSWDRCAAETVAVYRSVL